MSMKTRRAPRSTKALAVETKVNEGMMTSSPGFMSSKQRCHLQRVRTGGSQQRFRNAELAFKQRMAFFVNAPSPESCQSPDSLLNELEIHFRRRMAG